MDERGKCDLPISRVRTIMKSSPDVSNINQEALFLAAKATVLLLLLNDYSLNIIRFRDAFFFQNLCVLISGIPNNGQITPINAIKLFLSAEFHPKLS